MDRALTQDESEFVKEKTKEALDSFAREDAEKDLRKTIGGDVEAKTGIPKKFFTKMTKIFYKQSLKEEVEILDDITVIGQQLGYVAKDDAPTD